MRKNVFTGIQVNTCMNTRVPLGTITRKP